MCCHSSAGAPSGGSGAIVISIIGAGGDDLPVEDTPGDRRRGEVNARLPSDGSCGHAPTHGPKCDSAHSAAIENQSSSILRHRPSCPMSRSSFARTEDLTK